MFFLKKSVLSSKFAVGVCLNVGLWRDYVGSGPILKLISIQFYVRLAKGFPIINLHLHIRSLIILMLLIPQSEMNTGLPLGWSSGTKF